MTTLTALLAGLKALGEKATARPWGFGNTFDDQRMILGDAGEGKYVCNVQIHQTPRAFGLYDEEQREANAALIVALVNALPEIIQGVTDMAGERDEALSRVDELELEGERVAHEFEGECWKAMRRLLNECHFDWSDMTIDGITADEAEQHIKETLDEMSAEESRLRSSLAKLRAEMDGLIGAIAGLDREASKDDRA